MKKAAVFGVIVLSCLYGFSFSPKRVYYSDQTNPPEVQREPSFETTRKHIKKDFYYLNIRYPRQGAKSSEPETLSMKFSVGNESDDLILFQVARLQVSAGGKPVKILPVFYDENTGRSKKGWPALEPYVHRVPSHEHRTIEVEFLPETMKQKELLLEIAVLVTSPSKKDMTRETIKLHRGFYK